MDFSFDIARCPPIRGFLFFDPPLSLLSVICVR
jgi:hypothetical protein